MKYQYPVITLASLEVGGMSAIISSLSSSHSLKERGRYIAQIKNFLCSLANIYCKKLPARYKIINISLTHNIPTQDNEYHFQIEEIKDDPTTTETTVQI